MKSLNVLKRCLPFFYLTVSLVFTGYCACQSEVLVLATEGETLPHILINGLDVSSLTKEEIISMIEQQMEDYRQRQVSVHVGDKVFETTLANFNPMTTQEMESLANEIITLGKDLELMQQSAQIKEPMQYDLKIDYCYDHSKVEQWVRSIEKEVYIEKLEPNFDMVYYGYLKLSEGQDGQFILAEELMTNLTTALDEVGFSPIEIEAKVMIDPRQREVEELKTINTKISSYSTSYAIGIPRAKNVEVAASKVNGTIVMPGEVFSYSKQVSPVDAAHGYVNATIFFNGKPVPGIGGGICQVSSTLYNAQLKAGIVATERRNHSLPVSYVPLGQDATIADYAIDLKFVNTLDYPIFIYAFTEYGELTVQFWSNEQALHGITYLPKTVIYDGGLKADTTLYGYNSEGRIVFEQFLHTSSYKKAAH